MNRFPSGPLMTLACMSACVALVVSAARPCAALDWRSDFDKAKAVAAAANRPVLMDFWAHWCAPCRSMDDASWPHPDVVAAASRFECVRCDLTTSPSTIADFYGVREIPTVLVLDAHGRVALRITDDCDPARLSRLLNALPRRASHLDSLVALGDAPVRSADEGVARAELLLSQGCLEPSARLCEQLRKMKAVRDAEALREHVEFIAAQAAMDSYAAPGLKRMMALVDRTPHGTWRREELASVVRGCLSLKDLEKADRYLGMMKQEFPDDSLTVVAARAREHPGR